MSVSLTRDEVMLLTRAIKGQVRFLEKEIGAAMEKKDEKKELKSRDRVRWYRKILTKLKAGLEAHSNLIHITSDDFEI